jgi:hypothetical protein
VTQIAVGKGSKSPGGGGVKIHDLS